MDQPHAAATHAPDPLDGAWKCALDCLLEECLSTCFPAVAALLDWSRPFTIVDGELHQPPDGSVPAPRACHADRVYQCYTRDGRPLCLHIEVQCQHDEHFSERMFVYHTLLFARHRVPIVSLAILGDDSATWRPAEFGYGLAGSAVRLRFASVKLRDLQAALPAWLAAGNGFAVFAAAHLEIMQTKGEPLARLAAKCRLTRIVCDFDWPDARLAQMLELLDRLMPLPPQLDARYRQNIRDLKGGHMLTLMQRLRRDQVRRVLVRGTALGMRTGRQEGRDEGRKLTLIDLAQVRFGPLPASVAARLDGASPDQIRRWTQRFCGAQSLDDLLD